MNDKFVKDFFNPFSESQAFFAATIATRMNEFGITADDVIDMIHILVSQRKQAYDEVMKISEKEIKERNKKEVVNHKLRCPECDSRLRLTPVNVSKCTNIGGAWKTSIMCQNAACKYTELSTKTIKELVG